MIYLDNAASALPFEEAVVFSPEFGNPSSDHSVGHQANAVLGKTRALLSMMFGGRPSEYHFCSGATEAANLIIQGRCHFLKMANPTRNEIIVSAIEHPAIFNTVEHMRQSGFIVHIVPVDHRGIIEASFIYDILNENTSMVLVMGVNNETGARQPIDEIARKVKSIDSEVSFICDGVQTLTKVASPDLTYIDALIGSGHKLGAAMGIGFFYLNRRFRLSPLLFGGEQEAGVRPGTENIYGIESLHRALEHHQKNADQYHQHVHALNLLLQKTLEQSNIPFSINTQDGETSDYILSICFNGIDASRAIKFLSQRGICVSKGSACSSVSPKPSRVLSAMKLTHTQMSSTLRVSFSPLNVKEDVLTFCAAMRELHSHNVETSTLVQQNQM
ncbi:cysteine desulfurase [Pseudomonas frederiksbergensis]|uniref:cysteine desulfurase family protein n=1 Tax=Pseudomonas frederiksbergensis TaxID=104087 RepID=UPI00197E9F17|nr:cysteine desulfurase family protein [Pseudomonas frederiksbergensis]MBN3863775.1 cysteine desulfurase [Pseudomonas frederiksbergensis]